MANKWNVAIFSALALIASACTSADPCADAASHLEACTGSVPAGFAAQCDGDTAEAIMALTCEQLADDATLAGKADNPFWGLEKAEGEACILNAQCAETLVCRPTGSDSGTLSTSDKFCSKPGTFGDFCDSDADCNPEVGLHCIGDSEIGLGEDENGVCRKPCTNADCN